MAIFKARWQPNLTEEKRFAVTSITSDPEERRAAERSYALSR
jgi:hypothetical protein